MAMTDTEEQFDLARANCMIDGIRDSLDTSIPDANRRALARGILQNLDLQPIAVKDGATGAYSMSMIYQPTRNAYQFTFQANTGSTRIAFEIPLSRFSTLQEFADRYDELHQERRHSAVNHFDRRHSLREAGAHQLQQAFKSQGIGVSGNFTEELFRAIGLEYKSVQENLVSRP